MRNSPCSSQTKQIHVHSDLFLILKFGNPIHLSDLHTKHTIGVSPGRFVWVVINWKGKCVEKNYSNKIGLVLVQFFVKVVRQTYVTSAKEKVLNLNPSFTSVL